MILRKAAEDSEKMKKYMQDMMDQHVRDYHMEDIDDTDEPKGSDFADDTNQLFPINTTKQILLAAAQLCDPNIAKFYTDVEQLYMFNKLVTAATTILNNENDHNRLRDILKGGCYRMGDVYTKEQMEARAKELAEEMRKNDEEAQKAAALEAELAQKAKEAEEAATKLAETQAELDRIKAEQLAAQLEAQKLQAATEKMKVLTDAGFNFGDNSNILFAYFKDYEVTEKVFADIQAILNAVASSAKENAIASLDGEKIFAAFVAMSETDRKAILQRLSDKAKEDADKADEAAKAGLVDGSGVLPAAVESGNLSVEDEINQVFAKVFTKKTKKVGGDN